jgi:hypothetical protein
MALERRKHQITEIAPAVSKATWGHRRRTATIRAEARPRRLDTPLVISFAACRTNQLYAHPRVRQIALRRHTFHGN